MNEADFILNYSADNNISKENCPICGKQSLSISNCYCRDHINSNDTDKYRVEYDGVVCTEVNWETKEFHFIFKGKEYKYKQQGDISCNADTDHIRCVIEEFKEDLMKKEENNMKNYIVINGKKAEFTKEQLKQLGIEVEKKRNNPFERRVNRDYYKISEMGDIEVDLDGKINYDNDLYKNLNYFNDKAFANQVYLHELLNRKLLKYAYDNNAEDYEWDRNGVNPHYYIYFDSTKGHFVVEANHYCRSQNIYFSSMNIAEQAIKDIVEPFMEEYPEFVW